MGVVPMQSVVFPRAYFLAAPNAWEAFKPLAYDKTGELVVSSDHLEFPGLRIDTAAITKVSYVMQGRDFVNHWVKVEYTAGGESRECYFADGGRLGWSGVLGGTRRMFSAVQAAASEAHRDS